MRTRTALTAVLLALAAATTSCSSTEADPAACKAAMTKQMADAMESGKEGSRPAACAGIDDKTLQKLAGEVTKEWLDSDQADKVAEDALKSATPIPVPTGPEISPECRAWIENELQDSTDDIDDTAGYGACGDLTDEEMDQAIESVTQDLINTTP